MSARCRTARVRQPADSISGPDWYADRAGGDAISPPRTRSRSTPAAFSVAAISTGSAGRTDAIGGRHNDARLRPSVEGIGRGVAAYDLIATDDEQVTNAARRYFKSQPIATASMTLVTGHLRLITLPQPPWDE